MSIGFAKKFLSTSPLRGTTFVVLAVLSGEHISIHVPLAGDDCFLACRRASVRISIHVPLAGDDIGAIWPNFAAGNFYPRPPCGGRQVVGDVPRIDRAFLSTSPLRGTTRLAGVDGEAKRISIHVPLAGDDHFLFIHKQRFIGISIHVPLAGDDIVFLHGVALNLNFYPRPPCGGRQGQAAPHTPAA